MAYPEAAWERAMKVQEVIMKALTGELHWYRAADILGFSPRTLRRWRERYEQFGYGPLGRTSADPISETGAGRGGDARRAAVSRHLSRI